MGEHASVEFVLVGSMALAPIALLIHRTLVKAKEGASLGLGVRAVQFVGASMFPQMILVLALEHLIDGSTIAALVGAFVGYLFSGVSEFDRRPAKNVSDLK